MTTVPHLVHHHIVQDRLHELESVLLHEVESVLLRDKKMHLNHNLLKLVQNTIRHLEDGNHHLHAKATMIEKSYAMEQPGLHLQAPSHLDQVIETELTNPPVPNQAILEATPTLQQCPHQQDHLELPSRCPPTTAPATTFPCSLLPLGPAAVAATAEAPLEMAHTAVHHRPAAIHPQITLDHPTATPTTTVATTLELQLVPVVVTPPNVPTLPALPLPTPITPHTTVPPSARTTAPARPTPAHNASQPLPNPISHPSRLSSLVATQRPLVSTRRRKSGSRIWKQRVRS